MKKVKRITTKDIFQLAIESLNKGQGLPYIHQHYNVSLNDLREKSLRDDDFKVRLSRAVSGYEEYWRRRVDKDYNSNTEFNKNKLLYEECLKDCQAIRAHVTETVKTIDINFVDETNVEKKKLN